MATSQVDVVVYPEPSNTAESLLTAPVDDTAASPTLDGNQNGVGQGTL